MWRRVVVNLVLAFVAPFVRLVWNYIEIEVFDDHSYYAGPFWDYFSGRWKIAFIILPLVFFLLILLPYNIIILLKKRNLSFSVKFCIFLCIALLVSLYFFSVGFLPSLSLTYYLGVFAIIALFSLLYVFVIHYLVDRKTLPHQFYGN